MSKPRYEIKNLKTGPSREFGPNGAYTCTLYRDNKRVATVFEAGDGGDISIEWLDRKQPKVQVSVHNHNGGVCTYSGTPEQKKFAEFVDTQTFEWEYSEGPQRHGVGTYIGTLVGEFEENRQYKRWCRNETVFRLKGDGKGQWRRLKAPFSDPRVKPYLDEKYGEQVEEILNERFQ